MTTGVVTAHPEGATQIERRPVRSTTPMRRRVRWCLRIGAAACFIGHGAFGIITKAAWLPYFAVVGIPAGSGVRDHARGRNGRHRDGDRGAPVAAADRPAVHVGLGAVDGAAPAALPAKRCSR